MPVTGIFSPFPKMFTTQSKPEIIFGAIVDANTFKLVQSKMLPFGEESMHLLTLNDKNENQSKLTPYLICQC